MCRNGRAIDPAFLPSERLYFRFKAGWLDDDGRIKPSYIHFPDQSVNREKYSKPRDVLLPDGSERSRDWILWGVVTVRAGDVPPSMTTDGNVCYQFNVEHAPDDSNYAHSELRVYKENKRETESSKVNKRIKKKYRTILAQKTRVIIQPLS